MFSQNLFSAGDTASYAYIFTASLLILLPLHPRTHVCADAYHCQNQQILHNQRVRIASSRALGGGCAAAQEQRPLQVIHTSGRVTVPATNPTMTYYLVVR